MGTVRRRAMGANCETFEAAREEIGMNVMAMVNEGGPETATTTLREHLSSTLVSIGTYEQVEISAVSGARLDVVALSHYGPAQEMLVAFRYFDRSVTEPWSIGSIGDAIRVAMAEVREI